MTDAQPVPAAPIERYATALRNDQSTLTADELAALADLCDAFEAAARTSMLDQR